jgi:cobalamin synthase
VPDTTSLPADTTREQDRESAAVRVAATVAAPTTTSEQDRKTAGQRRVNIIWEVTQALIAIWVTGATLFVSSKLALKGSGETAAFLLLSNAFFLVIGFYFGRTNHQRTGGVGGDVAGTR